jgi:hypothetical protein
VLTRLDFTGKSAEAIGPIDDAIVLSATKFLQRDDQ